MSRQDLDTATGYCTATVHRNQVAKCMETPPIQVNGRYKEYRRMLVDWICEAGAEYNISPSTTHVCVSFMDRILGQVPVERSRLQLVSLACLFIAAKFEEPESNIPSAHALNQYAQNHYSEQLIIGMERLVLEGLNWQLKTVTPVHLLDYYMTRGVLFHGDCMAGDKPGLVARLPKYMKKYAYFFADLSLQEYRFSCYHAPILALAIVLASRRALRIRPVWREELCQLCHFTYEQVHECFKELFDHYLEQFPEQARELAQYEQLDDNESPDGVDEMDGGEYV